MEREPVSIVVPVYNCEAYIEHCIESILAQSYGNFELILIDDGSRDASGAICDRYAETDSRVRVFHGENRGVSAARREGVDRSSADYVAFVDADDYIDVDYIETLITALVEEQGDVVCSDYIDEGERSAYLRIEKREIFCRTEEMLDAFFKGMGFAFVNVGKVFKKGLLEELRFENMAYGEDTLLMLECFAKCKKMILIPYSGYHYVMNPGSITNYNSELSRWRGWMRRVEVLTELCGRPDLKEKFGKRAEDMYARYLFASLCANCKYASEEEFREFSEAYKGYYSGIRAGAGESAGKAAIMWIFSRNRNLARSLVRLNAAVKKAGTGMKRGN